MNLFKRFERLIPRPILRVATVLSVDGTSVRLEEANGGTSIATGTATVGQKVYVREGAIVGPAPNLPVEVIEE